MKFGDARAADAKARATRDKRGPTRQTETIIRRHIIVHGTVQGVGFRWSTQARAADLGLTGYVCNLPDGSVEVEAQGPQADIDVLLEWLSRGPQFAQVDSLDVDEMEPRDEAGFSIR